LPPKAVIFAHDVISGKPSAMAIILRAATPSVPELQKGLDTKAATAHRHPIARTNCTSLIVPFQGPADQKLYVLFSFDAIRGNILHISSNFTPIS
jgi:hypothetical protein